jgi:hypothetical protein
MEEELRVSALTRLLLTKYNTPFDDDNKDIDVYKSVTAVPTESIKKTMKLYLEDLTKLNDDAVYKLTQIQRTSQTSRQVQELNCDFTNHNQTKIHELSFIEDVDMVLKIIMYRKQEILREMAFMQIMVSLYYNILAKILNLSVKKGLQMDKELIELKKTKSEIEKELQNYIVDNRDYLLRNILERYQLLTSSVEKLVNKK